MVRKSVSSLIRIQNEGIESGKFSFPVIGANVFSGTGGSGQIKCAGNILIGFRPYPFHWRDFPFSNTHENPVNYV